MSSSDPSTRRTLALASLAALSVAGCLSARVESEPAAPAPEDAPAHAHAAMYYVSCSVSDECRVTFIDGDGELKKVDVTGEWKREFGTDPGIRLWVQAGAGGCPPRPVRVEIRIDDRAVAEYLARPPGGSRCEWILAETEYRVP